MTKSKIMTIIAAVAVSLVVVLAVGFIFNLIPSKDSNGSESENTVLADKVDNLILQDITFFGNPVSEYSVQPMSATVASDEQVVQGNSTTLTLQLTSNVLSEVMLEKVNIPVTWKLEFVNPNSNWAKGKTVTDYVTVQPQSDFTRTVTITNLAAFGEQLKLTATMDSDSDKMASCTIDYVKRITGGLSEIGGATDFGDELNVGGKLRGNEAVGTIMGSLTAYGTYLELDDGFISLLKSYLKFDITVKGYSFSNQIKPYIGYHDYYDYYAIEVAAADAQGKAINLDYSHFISNWSSLTEAQKKAVKYAWYVAYNAYGKNLTIDIVFDYSYGGKDLGTLSGNCSWYITGESYGSDISVDGSLVNIVF